MSSLRILLLSLVLFISACSPLSLLNSTVNHNGYVSTLNQSYGSGERQHLNVHVPRKKMPGSDVLIFFYGGRWQFGNKEEYTFVADAFTSKGIITVLPDYHLYPAVGWQDFVRDGATAYQWVYDNIAKHGGNPRRIFVMGHSAGAYIAAMVAVDESLLGDGSKRPCGFIGLAGPYNFLPIEQPDIRLVFSDATDLQSTQPINYVSKTDPEMLLLHGKDDTTVKPVNSTSMAEAVQQQDGRAKVLLYSDVDHTDILVSLSSTFRHYSPALQDSVEFIKNTDCR